MKNKVQLITYADRLGGRNITELHRLLKGSLAGLVGGVHILPSSIILKRAMIPSITVCS